MFIIFTEEQKNEEVEEPKNSHASSGSQSTQRVFVSEQTDVAFLRFVSSFGAICGETIQPIAKVSEEVNRNLLPAKNILVVLVQNFTVRPTLPIR